MVQGQREARAGAAAAIVAGVSRAGAGGVTPATHAGLPCDVMVIVALVRPGEAALMTVVPA